MTVPDIRPHFPSLYWRPMPHSYGVPVASDWQDKPKDDPVFGPFRNCGLWTMDEAAILYQVAKQSPGTWVDIGANIGWTTAHIRAAGRSVCPVDTMYGNSEFRNRAAANLDAVTVTNGFAGTSAQFLATFIGPFSGIVIDGDHDDPNPTTDAAMAVCRLDERAVILFHDARGGPVKKAIRWLLNYFPEFHCRLYPTPHGVALCWRGELEPPEYEPLPGVPEFGI